MLINILLPFRLTFGCGRILQAKNDDFAFQMKGRCGHASPRASSISRARWMVLTCQSRGKNDEICIENDAFRIQE